jgi:hypothetical protein
MTTTRRRFFTVHVQLRTTPRGQQTNPISCSNQGHTKVSVNSNGHSGFSLYQTEPTQGIHSGQTWSQGHAGEQYCDPALANGFSHDAFPISFSTTCQMTEDDLMMSRQDSLGAHSVGTAYSSGAYYNQAQSGGMYPTLSQTSYPMSPIGSDGSARSNSPDYTPTPQNANFLDNYLYHGDIASNPNKVTAAGMQSQILAEMPYTDNYMNDDAYFATFIHDPEMASNDSSAMFNNNFMSTMQPLVEDSWQITSSQMRSPSASSSSEGSSPPMDYSQIVTDVPTSVVRSLKKTGPRQSKVNSDLARNTRPFGVLENPEEFVKYTTGRAMESDNHARDHELYHNAAPHADGLYHCPWEGQDCCQHRPEKLKCNYEYDPSNIPQSCSTSQKPYANQFAANSWTPI